jgi:hypothetical protein
MIWTYKIPPLILRDITETKDFRLEVKLFFGIELSQKKKTPGNEPRVYNTVS